MRTFISPYADFLCYCLMPNHFHWLIFVRQTVLEVGSGTSSGDFESTGEAPGKRRSLNDSIAILLRSYTRAINKQRLSSGALFREDTKAKSGWIDEFITVDRYRKGKSDFRAFPDNDYGWNCFNYIHENPKHAGLVSNAIDWPYSSARDFAGLRNGTLCNQKLAKNLLHLP